MTGSSILPHLQHIREILLQHDGDDAQWVASLIELGERDMDSLYRALNSKRMWGGAGSVANQALADNPGVDEILWQTQIREFRECMIELGHHLKNRGDAYPDIDFWLSAFSSWNQTGL